jgi:cation diffusion facilitator CzcD-associated flavoprotein CzcO
MRRSLRVAVIGAGAAGLAAARELRREGHAPVVFERSGGVGGTWMYDPRAEEDGGHHSSLYESLRTNLPREVMGFLDFPFAATPGSLDTRRFPRHEEVLRYLQEFARRFDLYGLVRFGTEVTAVDVLQDRHHWRVRWRKADVDAAQTGEDGEEQEEFYDAVVVCNGHYTEPRIADIPGNIIIRSIDRCSRERQMFVVSPELLIDAAALSTLCRR